MCCLVSPQIAVYLWVLRIASRGQADRAFRYAKFYMIDRLKHGHASATSVAAGVQEELKRTAWLARRCATLPCSRCALVQWLPNASSLRTISPAKRWKPSFARL